MLQLFAVYQLRNILLDLASQFFLLHMLREDNRKLKTPSMSCHM